MKVLFTKDPHIIESDTKKLINDPVIIKINRFNEEAASKFSTEISKAHNTGQPVIPVIIDSFGGQAHALLHMISEIDNSDLPVATIAMGKAMSAGAILLGMGIKDVAAPVSEAFFTAETVVATLESVIISTTPVAGTVSKLLKVEIMIKCCHGKVAPVRRPGATASIDKSV